MDHFFFHSRPRTGPRLASRFPSSSAEKKLTCKGAGWGWGRGVASD